MHQIQKNKHKPCEQVKSERPIFLTNKGQPMILSWVPNPHQSLLRNSQRGLCMVTLLYTAVVLTPGLTVVLLGESRRSDGRPPWGS